MKKKLMVIFLAALVIASPVLAKEIAYTGVLFDYFGATKLCAKATDSGAGVPGVNFYFKATNLWGISDWAIAGPSNALGNACGLANWPAGVWEVTVSANSLEGWEGVVSDPVVLTIVSYWKGWKGFVAGGELLAEESGTICGQQECAGSIYLERPVTFGLVEAKSMITKATLSQFLILDPQNPHGPLRIWTRDIDMAKKYKSKWLFKGECWYKCGTAAPRIAYFDIIISKAWPNYYADIKIFNGRRHIIWSVDGVINNGGVVWM